MSSQYHFWLWAHTALTVTDEYFFDVTFYARRGQILVSDKLGPTVIFCIVAVKVENSITVTLCEKTPWHH